MGFFDKIFDSKETSIEESCVVCNDKINDLIDKYNYFYYGGQLKNANDGGDYSDDERKAWKYTKLIGHFRRKKVCWFCQHALTNLKGFGGWNEELTPHWEGIVKGNESKYYRQTIKNKAGNIVSEYEIINETNTDILFDYVSKYYKKQYEWGIGIKKRNEENQRQREKEAKDEEKKEQERKQRLNKKYDKKDADKILNGDIWIDMTKEMLIESWGKPKDTKEDISRNKVKLKWYYKGRQTRQGTISYQYEVRIENDIIEGWKELE